MAHADLAMVLSGGGARGAYQVGFLRRLGQYFPDLRPDILVGISAGAINASYFASQPGRFVDKGESLSSIWGHLDVGDVFKTDAPTLSGQVFTWGKSLISGGTSSPARGLVNTEPLVRTIADALGARAGRIPGLKENIEKGVLKAFAVATTDYTTGQAVTWIQGDRRGEGPDWEKSGRKTLYGNITVRHVLASASIPLFFPAVRVRGRWYGDGGVRLTSPLAPAVQLGADKIFAVSTRYMRTPQEADEKLVDGYPPPAQVIGVLMNAIFLDFFDQDARILQLVNQLVTPLPPGERGKFRPIQFMMVRPSQDLGRLANDYEPRLPGPFRFLTRGLGTRETRSNDALSLVMFQADYIRRLMAIGEEDAEARKDEIGEFLDG